LTTFVTSVANAAFFNNSTGLVSPVQTVTFSEHTFADDTVITNQFADVGLTFSPNLYYQNSFNPGGAVPNLNPPDLTNFIPSTGGGLVNPFSISFSSPVTGAAFVLATNPNTTLLTAFLNNVIVDTGSAPSSLNNPNDFYGFTGVTFDRIDVTVGSDGFAILDTVQTAQSVPEPSAFILLLGGAGTLAAFIRLRGVKA
jgi:hypothetical protein